MPKRSLSSAVSVPRPEAPSRRLVVLAWVAMVLIVLVLTVPYKVGVDDTWIQIRTGQYILEHGIPHTDSFSYTTGGRGYTEHEWLTCVLFALTWRYGGVMGFMVLKGLIVGLTYLLAVKTARTLGASWSVITLCFPCLVYLVTARVTERPHIFSSLFLMTYCTVFFRVRTGQLRPRWLWCIPLLASLWAQLHGGHIVGVAFLGCFALGEALHWGRARYGGGRVPPPLPGRTVAQLALLVPMSLGAACLGPYGTEMLTYPFAEAALERVLDWNGEWLPISRGPYYSHFFWVYVGYLTLLWGTWCARYPTPRMRGDRLMLWALSVTSLVIAWCSIHPPTVAAGGAVELPDYKVALLVGLSALVVLWGLWSLRHWQHTDLTQAAVCLLGVTISVRYARGMPDSVLLSFPCLTAAATALLTRPDWRAALRWQERRALGVGCGLLVVLAGSVAIWGISYHILGSQMALGFGVNLKRQPVCAVDFLTRHAIGGRAMMGVGAPWLLFKAWPAITVNIDSRLHVYGPERILVFWKAAKDPAAMAEYLRTWRPDFLLMNHAALYVEVYQFLVHTLQWHYVFMDDAFFVMVPPRADMQPLIDTNGYNHILTWKNLPVYPRNAREALQEADRALQDCPQGATFAHSYRAKSLYALGRFEDAERAGRQIPKRIDLN